MTKEDIINKLIEKHQYKKYLELGTQNMKSFNEVKSPYKIGIDKCEPDLEFNPKSTGSIIPPMKIASDDYFELSDDTFDIAFIDGSHYWEQALRDINNALSCLRKGGTVVVHDCIPPNEESQIVPREVKVWTGDVWKAFVKFRERNGFDSCVIDTDFGVGIISVNKKAKGVKVKGNGIYNNFVKNKKKWLNIKTVEEFSA